MWRRELVWRHPAGLGTRAVDKVATQFDKVATQFSVAVMSRAWFERRMISGQESVIGLRPAGRMNVF